MLKVYKKMTDRRLSLTKSILWHEGMLLTPQHFQQNDKRHGELISRSHHIANPNAFGIYQMAIDTLSLGAGLFKILEIEAVMPDGTLIHYVSTDKDARPLEIDLTAYKKDIPRDEISIYLTLPQDNASQGNNLGRYYEAGGNQIHDEHLSNNSTFVMQLLPNLSLSVSNSIAPNCTGFIVSKIQYNEVFLPLPYIPPCIFISHDMHIWQVCKNIARVMREKATHLSGIWQTQIGSAMLAETRDLLTPLVQSIPQIESMLITPYLSPYQLYKTMLDILCKLAPLKLSIIPSALTGYNHQDILSCITPILHQLTHYLDTIEQSYSIFPFQQRERLFYLYLSSSQIQATLYVGLRMPKGVTEEMMELWMMDAIIASDFAVEMVRGRRITGARRYKIKPETQFEMMPGRGILIFEIPFDPEFLAVDQNINIFNPNDIPDKRPTELVLHIQKAGIYEHFAMAG